ncbi:MAG: [protein-PII] uridylyltransferase [Burkholderiales bacterium]|nr:[protein-PII] uridylyltransferase [Burkholderiales bacterium]
MSALPQAVAAGRYRQELQAGRRELFDAFHAGGSARRLLAAHCRLVDRVLASLWVDAGIGERAALVAVGGYGRGELYPASDVDVLLLLPEDAGDETRHALEALIGLFWDIGIEVGHSVRTVPECFAAAAADITVQTTLIEARPLAGSRALFAALETGTRARLNARDFYTAKRLELEQRHTKYQDTPYSLEPNCKESPGGLRDLQVILWIARAAGLGTSWSELAARGVITRTEAAMLGKREALLQTIRARLHLIAGRREDRLLFDHQDRLAASFGYSATASRRASEQLMQRYYINCRWIIQLNTILLQNIANQLFPGAAFEAHPLNERFHVERDMLAASDPTVFETHPGALLECFHLLQQHAELKGMTAPTLRALWRARNRMDAAFRRDPGNRAMFMQILRSPRGLVHELRRMNQWGILGRYLPPFKRIIGQMQHDLFHVYTVDQHILTVVRNVRRFTMLEFAHEYPMCSRLIASFERHWLIYIAALFHDIAKGRGGDHSLLGRADARAFCRAHGIDREDTELVVFLVEHHLTMSSVAQKQDLSDPDVIGRFAAVVRDERRLIALYLLTVADIRGTSPKVWNAWKGKLLEDLFRATRRLLGSKARGGAFSFDTDLQEKQAEALRILSLYGFSPSAHEALWRQLDMAYFLRHDAKEIAWQTRALVARMDSPEPVVRARFSPIGEGLEVMVYVRDQPDLFARICGFFDRRNLTILDAKIHTTRNGYALDSFLVMDAGGEEAAPHGQPAEIERDLRQALALRAPLADPVTGRVSRQARHFAIEPAVNIRPDEKGQRYILSVTAGDRPGLLYRIALALSRHGVNLQTAKITTLGERAEDVFLIEGGDLGNPKSVLAIETDLVDTLRR